ncbi:MAG: hypothetical protein V2I57_04335 [Xanthomonadales bacterium]|nr:hypothetical protein [Xanthomonadales bacterium]
MAQDLSVQLALAEEERLRGEPLTVNFVAANPTTVEVFRYRIEFYASRDDSLDDQDSLLGEFRSVNLFIGNSFQENTIALDTCDLELGDWRILGRVTDVEPEDPNPGNNIGLAMETLSLPRDDDDPGTCPEGQGDAAIINPGLNDAWFNADTAGQGFFINVFGESGQVFLAWFTFDTEKDPTAPAVLGAPGQRWLTAFGLFDGTRAMLEVTNTRGGRFDRGAPEAVNETYGAVELSFESCARGAVRYDLPGPGVSGVIPITRVVPDNVALCEALAAGSPTASD